ncbi:hypothetical protein BJ322DRAFT_856860 [Thelephora terrestris]|uniref:Uncharacterized protein n=1 Tax=Thelephora terrestris TaxID=56493 RepID=A0A9P6HG40_9AGAM|nr:hypothetical protein BJ322DRAFT_856860 [Thelephora terrestris]
MAVSLRGTPSSYIAPRPLSSLTVLCRNTPQCASTRQPVLFHPYTGGKLRTGATATALLCHLTCNPPFRISWSLDKMLDKPTLSDMTVWDDSHTFYLSRWRLPKNITADGCSPELFDPVPIVSYLCPSPMGPSVTPFPFGFLCCPVSPSHHFPFLPVVPPCPIRPSPHLLSSPLLVDLSAYFCTSPRYPAPLGFPTRSLSDPMPW